MIVYWFFFLAYVAYAFYDIRKAIILWPPVHLLVNQAEVLWTFSPMLAIREAVSISLLIIFICKGGFNNKIEGLNKEPFFLKSVCVLYLLSYGLSTLFSQYNDMQSLFFSFKFFLDSFIIVFLFHKCFSTREDLNLFTYGCIWVTIIIVSLGISEFILGRNIWQDYVFRVNRIPLEQFFGRTWYIPPEATVAGEFRGRFGLARCFSTFGIHLGFGSACALMLFFVGSLWKFGYNAINKRLLTLTLVLLIVGTFLSNSKGPMLLMVVLLFMIFKASDLFRPRIVVACVTGLVVLFTYFPGYVNSFMSIIDEDLAEEGKGSSVELREKQLGVAMNLFSTSPIIGHGPQSLRQLKDTAEGDGIMGAESIWLKTMPERGLIGVLSFLFFYLIVFFRFKRVMPLYSLIIILCGLGLIETTNGQRDMLLYVPLFIVLYRFHCFRVLGDDKKQKVTFENEKNSKY